MKINKVVCTHGRHGFVHKDLAAIKSGAVADGFLFRGQPVTPGFTQIVQPGSVVSVMLLLDDGSVAHGDCVDVIFAGAAGRDPLFQPKIHFDPIEKELAAYLVGRDVSAFRPVAEEFDTQFFGGGRMHTAVRYGVSQALLHAAAIANRQLMVEVVAREYDCGIGDRPVPILVSVAKTDKLLLDRMIMKEVALLPHASFTVVEADLGSRGEKLLDFASELTARIKQIGAPHYKPRIHLDTYGTIGELHANDPAAIVEYLARIREAVAPYELLIESPVIAATRQEQIDIYVELRERLRTQGVDVKLVVDEWCNTLEDIRAFGAAKAADFVQIKLPDLGGLTNTIEAALYCRQIGLGFCLGGTANETDTSSRITTHVGLACGPDFLLAKPGLGGDEALVIQDNEMRRTLALLASQAG
jgi:methylaspartate ammonia-lyase